MHVQSLPTRSAIGRTGVAVLAALLVWAFTPGLSHGQTTPLEIELLEQDAGGVDRYRIHILPGTSMWVVATERLPLQAFDEGHEAALEVLRGSFERAFPGREMTDVHPGESFVLEVPAGTFVSESVEHTPDEIRYASFDGDELVYYARDPYVVYRLTHADRPDQAEVLVAGREAWFLLPDPDPVQLAARVYQVEQPDYLQVRWIRQVLGDTDAPIRLAVDLERRHLDQFRNYRERAIEVEQDESGLTAYHFSEAQVDIPFLRVDDGIGDEVNAASFPRVFRVEYYKDGTIRRFILTQPGDLLAVLRQPDNATWGQIHEEWQAWEEGQPGGLEPFAPAVTEGGSLTPGRILVLTHAPRPVRPTSGLECFGIPILIGGGMLLGRLGRRVRGR